jgi:hypothetical protein
MEKKGKEVKLLKVPINSLIDILNDLYNQGVDYVDIIGIHNVEQDTLGIRYNQDYLMKPSTSDDETMFPDLFLNSLSDEDINQII